MKHAFFITTPRLGFSEWEKTDINQAMLIWGDAEVTRYLCASGKFSEEEIQERLALEVENLKEFSVQYWPLIGRETGELVGVCGMKPSDDGSGAKTYEMGYYLRKIFWGHGYASEASAAVIAYGFKSAEADIIYAGHHPENLSSGRVLTKLGFRGIGESFYPPTGRYHPCYALTREEWSEQAHQRGISL